jgi:hypothetical protein
VLKEMTQFHWTFETHTLDSFSNVLRLCDERGNILASVYKRHTDFHDKFMISPNYYGPYAPTLQEAIKRAETDYHDMNYSWGELGKPTVPFIYSLEGTL